jgi:hypothetical protein
MRGRMPVRELEAKVSWESMLLPEAWPLMVRFPPIRAPGEASIGSGEAPTTMSSPRGPKPSMTSVFASPLEIVEDDFGASHRLQGLAGVAGRGVDLGVGAQLPCLPAVPWLCGELDAQVAKASHSEDLAVGGRHLELTEFEVPPCSPSPHRSHRRRQATPFRASN